MYRLCYASKYGLEPDCSAGESHRARLIANTLYTISQLVNQTAAVGALAHTIACLSQRGYDNIHSDIQLLYCVLAANNQTRRRPCADLFYR